MPHWGASSRLPGAIVGKDFSFTEWRDDFNAGISGNFSFVAVLVGIGNHSQGEQLLT